MRITKDDRLRARERNHLLCHVVLDGAEKRPPSGVVELVCDLPLECEEELWAMLKRWSQEGKI